ncbi:hypothetical protein RR42_s1751 [Cupriavidus basilensis]|uniref:Uncharacterized protein n=1 Tax=Cupriavidus basilensis TaxID=68895 RepID=A0A0C4YMQ2_9BURK|nr:hypothetical protein RR42_s1751 [Cupriavidus basilensis]
MQYAPTFMTSLSAALAALHAAALNLSASTVAGEASPAFLFKI